MNTDSALREHLVALLDGGQAHMTLDEAVANFPPQFMNVRPPNMSYSPWQLLEHIRISQWDILDYMRNPDYKEIEWPKDYWPAEDAFADPETWNGTVEQIRADLRAVRDIVTDPATDLTAPIPHGYDGHTLLREVLLVADHNAYHIGELGILRQVMRAWPAGHG